MMNRTLVICGAIGLLAAVASADVPVAERGAAILMPFKRDLKAALSEGMSRGPVEAIAACRLEAPRIASSLSKDGVEVGRTSERLRNPANAPRAWVKPILDEYLADPSKRAPQTRALPSGRSGYVEPILTQPLCLTCHGETLAPEVATRLRELYPEDEATGFEVGDLRGVFWVEFPTP